MDPRKIGAFIAAGRKEKGYTQGALASLLGVTGKAVSRWETWRGLPDITMLPCLSTALDVSVSELLAGARIEKENVPQAAEQLLVNALSEKRRIVRGVVSSCIALLVVLLLALFFFYGPAVFQRGNPLPYLRAMAILNRKQQFAEVPQRSGEYISLLGEAAEAAVLTHIEAEYDAIACDQHGRAFVFQQGETRFYVMTEVYWGRFRVWVIPPPPTSEAADTEE